MQYVGADLFVGQLDSCLICDECKNSSHAFDPFWSLALPIPQVRLELRSYIVLQKNKCLVEIMMVTVSVGLKCWVDKLMCSLVIVSFVFGLPEEFLSQQECGSEGVL